MAPARRSYLRGGTRAPWRWPFPAAQSSAAFTLESPQREGSYLRFRVEYPTRAPHEVELPGNVATIGRDPTSDLVLNDPKCSRRHAVIESSAEGITIRDSGSANGVFVNGRKTERSRLRDGDVVKLGDVVITLLPEPVPGTVVMEYADERAGGAGRDRAGDPELTEPDVSHSDLPAPALRVRPTPAAFGSIPDASAEEAWDEAEARSASAGRARPLTVTVLVALWALSVPLYMIAGVAVSWEARGGARAALVAAGFGLAVFAAVMAVGLWQGRRWGYLAQVGVAGVGLFLCPFSLASVAVLAYMLRPAIRWHFSVDSGREPEGVGQAEAIFAGAIVGAVVLGALLTAGLTFLARTARTVTGGPGRLLVLTPAAETAAVTQLRTLAAAQEAFHSVCNTGYGDLRGLRQPGTVIADYPAGGPAFLRSPAFDSPERDGYRYVLDVEEEMPPSPGCPSRRYRRYVYSATAMGAGRSLAVGPDGVVRAAEGRRATLDDPPAR